VLASDQPRRRVPVAVFRVYGDHVDLDRRAGESHARINHVRAAAGGALVSGMGKDLATALRAMAGAVPAALPATRLSRCAHQPAIR
jgi:hypothetical protein